MEHPDYILEEFLVYLDELRESGVTNMYGAGAYLINEFDMDKQLALKVLQYWMRTYSERQVEASNG